MPRLHFNPILEVGSLQRDLNRLLEWPTERPSATVPAAPLQVWESAEAYTVHLLIPGADRESLNIEAAPHQLSVSGEIKLSGPAGAELRYQEVEGKSFQRSLKLARRIQPEKVAATYTDGILSLTLPKAEAARAVKVQVSAPGEAPASKTVAVEGQSA
ncbi:Hsp20/alpha crystallin family protein [Thermostichus vulcanus]|uniref:Hsp20/alpha crystallin family protein n=1 Tax=Thermostichus vulcanus str. 'Rupite' TaxID=2813851 RepID=A0ABT0C8G1_THEVL|nr:Hsp20/alpha crystallin family protein [Thermostichus vulcanus]MCJ2542044.1 Hsp20/alpha crystallin family protein [Thermostichus vulcanus str. 'Rupite']